jgi:histidyl-tRNA synthetase
MTDDELRERLLAELETAEPAQRIQVLKMLDKLNQRSEEREEKAREARRERKAREVATDPIRIYIPDNGKVDYAAAGLDPPRTLAEWEEDDDG